MTGDQAGASSGGDASERPELGFGREAPAARLKTRSEWLQDLASAAFEKGRLALTGGAPGDALPWLERAHRLAPRDAAMGLALATARMQAGVLGPAIDLLEGLAQEGDIREVWLALATIRQRVGAPEAAAAAIARAFAGHAMADAAHLPGLADAIARAVGAPGWCALKQDGSLVIRRAGARRGTVRVRIDGAGRRGVPRRLPPGVRLVEVTENGAHLLGSPLRAGDMRRVEGVVWASSDGAIDGWAWHPGAPEADPRLQLRETAADGAPGPVIQSFVADDHGMMARTPLSRPRRFRIPPSQLAGQQAAVAVMAEDGRHLLGSPLVPFGEQQAAMAAARAVAGRFPAVPAREDAAPAGPASLASPPADVRGAPVHYAPRPERKVAVVVPVYGHAELLRECLGSVLATMPDGTKVIVVDDASPDPAIAALLARHREDRRIRVIRHSHNLGFPGAANSGIRAALALRAPHDVLLLNSDTIVPPGWIEGLRTAVHSGPDIGSATPLSNDATILSYPDAGGGNPLPGREALRRMARWAAAANRNATVEIPSAVGFCMYIRRECLVATGLFRDDLFAQGYGEENDFCIRARHLGWRHVAAPGVFVAHVGGQSFGAAREQLIERNLGVLERTHPGYHRLIAGFLAEDPLAEARRRIDVLRWKAGRRPRAVLLITHASGGGVERVIRERSLAIRAEGGRAIVLRSAMTTEGVPAYLPGICAVEEGGLAAEGETFPNLRFRLPDDITALARLLRGDRPERIELHHLLGHDHAVLRLAGYLGIPVETFVHDYAAFCPRISLVGRERRYCGEPENLAACDACVRDAGSNLAEPIGVRALRGRSAADLRRSRRVVVPSEDVAARMRRHFPDIAPVVEPLEDDATYPPARPLQRAPEHIAVIGGIGTEKGYDVLLACARNAAARRLNLRFTVIGHTHDDERLIETGRVFVTGPYKESEAVALIRAHDVDMAWQPSIWPETWCFTLGLAWRAGLCVAAFDIGAIAERIRKTGRGWLLPLGLPPAAINSAFIGLRRATAP